MKHICQAEFSGVGSMQEFYKAIKAYPTSDVGNIALIRSHIAYHAGERFASDAIIHPSRGHSYRVSLYKNPRKQDWQIVKIRNYYDHREGITGLFEVNAALTLAKKGI